MTSTAAFIFELIRAANEIDRLTKRERARLMERAATAIEDMREMARLPGAANDNDNLDIVSELREMARRVDLFSSQEIAGKILDAVALLRICARLLGMKDKA